MSAGFEAPQVWAYTPVTEASPVTHLQDFLHTCKHVLARIAMVTGLTIGIAGGEVIARDTPAIAEQGGGYPDADAAPHNAANYTWWRDKNINGRFDRGEDISPRGYGYRNCVDWAAFRIPQLVQAGVPRGWGNAKDWDDNARRAGVTVDGTPEPGDIAVWNGGDYGHVEVVESVNADASVNTSGYNKRGTGLYALRSQVRADAYIDLNGTGKGIGGTALGPTMPSADHNHDGFSDPYIVASKDSASGHVETHILNGTNFQAFLANIVTSAPSAPTEDAAYLLADYNRDNTQDLYIIGHNKTGSGKLEMHILAGPNFQSSLGDWVTPSGMTSEYSAQFALGDYNHDGYADLYIAALGGTDSGKTEVHILNGTNFQSFLGHWNTPAAAISGNRVKTILADHNRDGYPDVYRIVHNNTGSNSTEVHILNGTNFASWLGHWVTPVGVTDAEVHMTAGDYDHDGYADIYAAYTSPVNGKTAMHILQGTNFQRFLGQWVTAAPAVESGRVEVTNG